MPIFKTFKIEEVPWSIYLRQKKNQVFKLLPLREENGDWKKQLDTIIIELAGLYELSIDEQVLILTVLGKLKGLETIDEFLIYRKTVFEIISLLDSWKRGN